MNSGRKSCVTPGCNSNVSTDVDDDLCFGCRLSKVLVQGWPKKKKVWEWTYYKVLNENNVKKLTRRAKNVEITANGPRTLGLQNSSGVEVEPEIPVPVATEPVRTRNTVPKQRCGVVTCRKKLHLLGFRCRCEGIFCVQHRCSETHKCTVNYRALGVMEIWENNPRVVAEKIRKI